MKIVVMIPAYNEEASIASVIREIPRSIEDIDEIEILVIDDGSTDRTKLVALDAGATAIVSHRSNKGLASAFRTGLAMSLRMDADIIVNTDADFQYDQAQIPDLIRPILLGRADMVLGSRFRGYIVDMPLKKKIGNILATFVTRVLSGFNTSDAQSGFRAFNRELALSLCIRGTKTYVQETIIQPARSGYRLVEIPIMFRKREGESRLIKSIWGYAFHVFPDMIACFIETFGRKQTVHR